MLYQSFVAEQNVFSQDIFSLQILIIRKFFDLLESFKYQIFAIFKVYCQRLYLEGTFWTSFINQPIFAWNFKKGVNNLVGNNL